MELTEEEKEAFLQKMAELTELGVINRDARDAIFRIAIVACVNSLRGENNGADDK